MWKLKKPRQCAYQTYMLCISKIKDSAFKARLESVSHLIAQASIVFDAAASTNTLHALSEQTTVGGVVSKTEMETVYTQRMARNSSPGRDIYDELISAPTHGRCPLCGHRSVTQLDHHLPKARFAALCVAPLNLVPTCSDCNKAKLDRVPRDAADETLHPYYDDIDEFVWLRAAINQTMPASLSFYVDPPHEWGDVLRERVQSHFKTLGLARLYATEAAVELVNIRYQLKEIYETAGAEQVRAFLRSGAFSRRNVRKNSWQSATYEAMYKNEWFCHGGFFYVG